MSAKPPVVNLDLYPLHRSAKAFVEALDALAGRVNRGEVVHRKADSSFKDVLADLISEAGKVFCAFQDQGRGDELLARSQHNAAKVIQ